MRVAKEADQRDGRQAKKSEPLSPKEGVDIPDSSIVSGKSQSVGSASLEEEILSTLKSFLPQGTEPISFSATTCKQHITLSVTLQDAACSIGSQVEGSIAFQNYSRKRIRGIDVELSCQEYVRVRKKRFFFFGSYEIPWTREFQTDAIRIPVPEETIKEFQTDFSLSIPRSTPETGSWHFFDVRAFVKVNLDVAGVFHVSCSHEIDVLPAISPQ